MAEIHEHLEHAEHAEHAAHNPFDRKVAVSIAIIAAVLAGVAMIGHRTHNQTLLYQAQASGYDVQAGNAKIQAANTEVKESNAWAQYQSKKLRQVMADNAIVALTLGSVSKEKERDEKVKSYGDEVARYKGELEELSTSAKKIHEEIAGFNAKSKEFEAKAKADEQGAHHTHAQADYLDLAHLAVELGLVICSVALLTKKKAYWLGGIAFTVVGLCLVTYAMVLPKHAEHHEEEHAPVHVEKAAH